MQADMEKRFGLLVKALDISDDKIKLRILQEIAKSSNSAHLKVILPLSKYSNRLTSIAAANTARQILSRLRIGKLSIGSLPQDTIKEIIKKLDSNFESWREDELERSSFIRKVIHSLNGNNEHEMIDLCFGQAGMTLAVAVQGSAGAIVVDQGTELSNSHLIKIKAAGAKQITVKKELTLESSDASNDPTVSVDENDPIALQLNSRFEGHEQNISMMNIKSVIYDFLSSKAAAEEEQASTA
jgi:hypothetical protein